MNVCVCVYAIVANNKNNEIEEEEENEVCVGKKTHNFYTKT